MGSVIPGVIASSRRGTTGGLIEPHWGGNWQGLTPTDEDWVSINLFNHQYIRKTIILSQYNGAGSEQDVDNAFASGLKIICQFNWSGSGSGGGLKMHPTNEAQYRAAIRDVLADYGNKIEVAVIENEPFNGHFFNYAEGDGNPPYTTVAEYLDELTWASEECQDFGVLIADGCTHLQTYQEIINANGDISKIDSDHSLRVNEAMSGYANIYLDFVNFHFNVPHPTLSNDSTVDNDVIKDLTDYLKSRTGKSKIMTNEWHQEIGDPATTQAQQISMCNSIAAELRKASPIYAINFGGDGGSDALVFVNNNDQPRPTLTALGEAYRDVTA